MNRNVLATVNKASKLNMNRNVLATVNKAGPSADRLAVYSLYLVS